MFSSDDEAAQNYLQQALQQYQQISTPSAQALTVSNLPQETVQGSVNPETEQAITQGDTALNNIAIDPSSRQAQETALGGYTDIANAGGLDANAKLGIQQAEDAATAQSRGEQGAIQQQAQAEGQGGGLFDLTQRAINAQGNSNTAATNGMANAAEAEVNREAALGQMASVGSNIENTDYGQAANAAGAQDTINAANTATKNQVQNVNVGNNLTAQGENMSNAQAVNANNTTANQNNVYYNANLPQQVFNDELQKANGVAGVNTQQAGTAQTAANNSNAATGQLIQGGATLLGTMYGGPAGGAAAGAAAGAVTGGNKQNSGAKTPAASYSDGGIAGCYAKGGEVHNHFLCMLGGGPVPGEANVPGDSVQNDTVNAKLSPGEGVIKRTKMADPDEAAKEARKISMEAMVKGYNKPRKK